MQPARIAQARSVRFTPPTISHPLLRWFLRYARYYVGRHMHAVRVSQEQKLLSVVGRPLLLYMNHPAWWDPMIAAVLAERYLPNYSHYTPIDAAALEKYRFFSKLGFFPMKRNSFESQRRLLDIGAQVLSRDHSALWITPQGRFADVRERPLRLGQALSHLVRHVADCVVVPVAVEYAYWEESKPEVLVRIGEAMEACKLQRCADAARLLDFALERALDELSQASIARDLSAFRSILSGNSGVGGIYDLWRRSKAMLKGSRFNTAHGGHQQ